MDMTMKDVRAKFPQYNDMSDSHLATALHKKYYSDVPFAEFSQKIGLVNEAEQQAATQKASANLAQTFVSELSAIGDLVAGVPGMVSQTVGEVASATGQGVAALIHGGSGIDWAEARKTGQELPTTKFLENPVAKAVKAASDLAGVQLSEGGKFQHGMETITGGLEKAAHKAEDATGISSDAYMVAGDVIMSSLGLKGIKASAKGIADKLDRAKSASETGSVEDVLKGLDEEVPSESPAASAVEWKRQPAYAARADMPHVDIARNAENTAMHLLQDGAPDAVVAKAIRKNPMVGAVLDRMRSERENFTAAFSADASKRASAKVDIRKDIFDVRFRPATNIPDVGADVMTVGRNRQIEQFYNRKFVELEQAKAEAADSAYKQKLVQEQHDYWSQSEAAWIKHEQAKDPLYNNPNFTTETHPFVLDGVNPSDMNAGGSRLMSSAFRAAGARNALDVARAYEHGELQSAVDQLKKVNKQAGKADPKLLVALSATGLGGAIGAYIAQDDKLRGAIYGSLTAFSLPYMRDITRATLKPVEALGGVVSTRLSNIAPKLRFAAVNHERLVLSNAARRFAEVDPLVKLMSKLRKEPHADLSKSLLNNDTKATVNHLKGIGSSELAKAYVRVRKTLDEIGHELVKHGLVDKLRKDYFPRIVKDVDGLKEAMGSDLATQLQKELDDAHAKAVANGQGALSEMEMSNIISDYIRRPEVRSKPGFTKQRVFDSVPDELAQFYHTPADALYTYVSNATAAVERAKFFGKHLKVEKGPEGRLRVDLNSSVNDVITDLVRTKKMKIADMDEAKVLLKTIFSPQKPSHAAISWAKDVSYASILGQFASAANQIGDVFIAGYAHGYIRTAVAAAKVLRGKSQIDFDATGLSHKISQELSTTPKAAKFLHGVFKASGFSQIDFLGKKINMQAALSKYQKWAKTPKGVRKIIDKYGESLSKSEITELVKDLDAGKRTDLVDSVLFSELSDLQPISKLELPKAYIDHPNGRIMYMFKSFAIKQLDIARRDGYNTIKKGVQTRNPALIGKGITNLSKLAVTLGVAGASTQFVTDYLMGNPVDMSWGAVADQAMRTFGWSNYTTKLMQQGHPVKAVASVVAPPYQMFETMMTLDPKMVRYLPVVGRFLYDKYYGGTEEKWKKQQQEQMQPVKLSDTKEFKQKF